MIRIYLYNGQKLDRDYFEVDLLSKESNNFMSSLKLLPGEEKLKFILNNWDKLTIENLDYAINGADGDKQEEIKDLQDTIENLESELEEAKSELEEYENDIDRWLEQEICGMEVGELLKMTEYLPNETKFEYFIENFGKITEEDLRKIVER